jgi:GTP 3',8-cyclase
MQDIFARKIDYVRLSLTDRCDLRCQYCMLENQKFLPRNEVLSFEEICTLVDFLCQNNVRNLRLTGGEPLVRKDVGDLISRLGQFVQSGRLDELTMTTNGTLLRHYAKDIAKAGIKRINVSLDTINAQKYRKITRNGDLSQVLAGIDAAIANNIRVKINCVVLKQDNLDELPQIIEYAHSIGADISLIETMPMDEKILGREEQYVPLNLVRQSLERQWKIINDDYKTKGPSQYFRIVETGGRIGFITPMSHNFCAACNRVRITCTGKLYMCLGHDDFYDLRPSLSDFSQFTKTYQNALLHKPKAHDFLIGGGEMGYVPRRPMSLTGG